MDNCRDVAVLCADAVLYVVGEHVTAEDQRHMRELNAMLQVRDMFAIRFFFFRLFLFPPWVLLLLTPFQDPSLKSRASRLFVAHNWKSVTSEHHALELWQVGFLAVHDCNDFSRSLSFTLFLRFWRIFAFSS